MKKLRHFISLVQSALSPAVAICLGLSVFGCLVVFNATFHLADPYEFLLGQLLWLLAGGLVMVAAAAVPGRCWRSWGLVGAVVCYVLLLAAPGFGIAVNGLRGWFAWRGWFVQPSELAKPFFVLTLALVMERTREHRDDWLAGAVAPFGILLVWSIPLLVQPDTGAVLVYGLTFLLVFFCLGGSLAHLALNLILVSPVLALLFRFGTWSSDGGASAVDYVGLADGSEWHVAQFQHALASGGLFGQAMGRDLGFRLDLPPGHGGSIFATFGESMGLLGLTSLLLILMAWVLYGYRRSRIMAAGGGDEFSVSAMVGLTAMIGVQAALHLSSYTGLVPPVEVKLPLISYGGSALVAVFMIVGIAESIFSSCRRNMRQRHDHWREE